MDSFFRIKKWVASKASETQLGRSTVVAATGEDGDHVIQALKSSVSKLYSHSKAKEIKKDILKIAGRFAGAKQRNKRTCHQLVSHVMRTYLSLTTQLFVYDSKNCYHVARQEGRCFYVCGVPSSKQQPTNSTHFLATSSSPPSVSFLIAHAGRHHVHA